VGLEAFFQRDTRSVQTHHRIVRRDAELDRDATDRHAVDHHPTQDRRVFGLQLFSLHEDAPAVAPSVGDGGELELVCRQDGLGLLSQLVEQDVPHHPTQPGLGPSRISHLLGPLQRSLDGELDDFLGVDTRSRALTNEPQKLLSAGFHRVVHRTHQASIRHRVHLPSRNLTEMMRFDDRPAFVNFIHDIELLQLVHGFPPGPA
jgi:hypothetical protein